ncbi:MAG: pilus assembly protein N-terminal domain-containing protein [Lachnospiraceae bacterium]|nr:pilus assembly protein N-terminal domain-containing protein [Lachnospiraceae bacterium]
MSKVMKKALALVLALTMVFSTVVVSSAAKKAKTNAITVSTAKKGKTKVAATSKITVKKGAKVYLNTTASKCKVKSSKKSVATAKVSKKKITVTAKKVGTTKLTITKKGYKTVTVTVKVAKKAPSFKVNKSKVEVTAGSTAKVKVTTTAKKIKVATSKKSVATAKVSKKTVTISAKKAGSATIYVSDKNNAAAYKAVKVTVKAKEVAPVTEDVKVDTTTIKADPAKGEVSFKLPTTDIKKITKVVTKVGKTDVTISDAELAEITTAVADKKVAELLATKTKGQKDKDITLAGKKVTVVTEYDATKGADVKYAGKAYNVKADNAKSTVTVNGKTATYNAADGTVTYSGLNADQLKKAEQAIKDTQFTVAK